jgi:outer membrane lipoprotein-sorting protein
MRGVDEGFVFHATGYMFIWGDYMKNKVLCGMAVMLIFCGAGYGQCCALSAGADANEDKAASKVDLGEVLSRVEGRLTKLHTFRAEMEYQVDQVLLDSRTVRHGTMYYAQDSNTVAFRVNFRDWSQYDLEEEESAEIEPVKYQEDYIFDGQWLSVRNEQRKSLRRVEVSKGKVDPNMFRLGKGPVPLPFALKKDDVLKEFKVEEVEPTAADPNETRHLVLTPRETSSVLKRYKRYEMWVSVKNWVPVQVLLVSQENEVTRVRWTVIELDMKLDKDVFVVPVVGSDWSVEVVPLARQGG